jgi:hypothetical protein
MVRKGLALLAVAALAPLIAAPAAEAARPKPPSKLWYKVKASYQWTQRIETVHSGPLAIVETAVTKGRFDLQTPRGDAPLVRRARNGVIGFGVTGGANVVGRYQNVDRMKTTRWTPGNTDLKGCSTTSIVQREHLSANPDIHGFVALRAGRFDQTLSTAAQLLWTDDSGVVTCPGPFCPRQLPGRSSGLEATAPPCTYRPDQESSGPAPLEGLPTANQPIRDALNAAHDFELPSGFGDKAVNVDSTATGTYEWTLSEHGLESRTSTETVVETIKFGLARCPGGGRKPC